MLKHLFHKIKNMTYIAEVTLLMLVLMLTPVKVKKKPDPMICKIILKKCSVAESL